LETLVFSLCGFWLWLTRKSRTSRYSEVADTLASARTYLWTDWTSRASTQARGFLLPEQAEALTILDRQAEFLAQTSRRFHSLRECRKLVVEELTQPPNPA
jgi:hypothetical protein